VFVTLFSVEAPLKLLFVYRGILAYENEKKNYTEAVVRARRLQKFLPDVEM
jgi:hypothetical protein